MKIVLHGVLAEQFGPEFEIATSVPADAIEGLSRQLPNWPRELLIDCIGFDTEDKLRAPTDATEIHLVPSMRGGGGKWVMIAIGVALIAAAFLIPGAQLAALGLTKGMIIMMGASFLMSGISQMFMKAPTIGKSNDPPASNYFSNNKNTTAYGTLMTMAWGRIKLAGQWLSVQVDSSDLVTTSFPLTTS